MTSDKVYDRVRQFVSNHDHKFQNIYVHSWEADHFSVTASMYSYEIEVKVSRSDFFADFKKPKHHFFKGIKNGYSILPGDKSWIGWGHGDNYIRAESQHIKAERVDYKNCPNKFFYACPVGLVQVHEVPKYAGLLYVMDSGLEDIRIVKPAPYLHKEKFVPHEMLFSKYMYGYIDLKNKLHRAEYDLKWMREEQERNTHTTTEKQPQPIYE